MKQAFCAAVLATVLGPVGPALGQERIGPIELSQAATYFAELETACVENDGGTLWGVEVCGAVLLVDPQTRRLVGNRPDKEGLLQTRDGVHTGTLPAELPVANAPVAWAGVRWAMVVVQFLGADSADRVTLLAHESFHRLQPELGLYAFGEENTHLAEADGRTWMQLEWNALQMALEASGAERQGAISDALAFRASRRSRYRLAAPRENAVEIREGLAQYTGLRIAGRTPSQVVQNVLARRAREDGIVRSFGYNSGPLYGYLLDRADTGWRKRVRRDSDLAAMLAEALEIEVDTADAELRAAKYDGNALRATEAEREAARRATLQAFRDSLIDGPVLILDLSLVRSATMDTRAVVPFDEQRTVFTVRRLVADWGVLEVEGGAILEDRSKRRGHLSLHGAAPDKLSGDGWTLQIASGWVIGTGNRAGDAVLYRQP